MSKISIYVWSDDLDFMTADKFIKEVEKFSLDNNTPLEEIRIETDAYEGTATVRATCYRLETDEEYSTRQKQEQARKNASEKEERRKYEELKKRFG